MTSLTAFAARSHTQSRLCIAFLKWQCRVRQNAMRDNAGRPDDGIMPALFLPGEDAPLGHIITLLNKVPDRAVTPELNHIMAKTNDPAQWRDQAIRFLSATYYQKAAEFSDTLTATFPPGSTGAAKILAAGEVRLVFDAFAQVFDLPCRATRLSADDPSCQATLAHNRLFNPTMPPGTEVVAFEPDWSRATSDPEFR